MRDGHTGISHRYVREAKKDKFHLALSYLKTQDIGGFFVVHVVPTATSNTVRLNEVEFLEMLRFEKYKHACGPFGRQCWYKYVFETQVDGYDWDVTSVADEQFDSFAESIDEAFSTAQQLVELVGHKFDLFPWAEQFRTEPKLLDLAEAEPGWLADWRVDEHQRVLHTLEKAQENAKHFRTIEYCLWGTGDDLVDSVHYILTDLGLKAEKTKEGATVDLILDYPPKDVEMGVEVTGLSGKIDKRSPKMNQAFTYIQECRDNCKGVILANTYNDTPLTERSELEHFTEPAVKLMEGMEIVGVTTMDLYRIWQDVKSGDVDIDTVVGEICDHKGGVYRYTH
jgi:hypothetical protein